MQRVGTVKEGRWYFARLFPRFFAAPRTEHRGRKGKESNNAMPTLLCSADDKNEIRGSHIDNPDAEREDTNNAQTRPRFFTPLSCLSLRSMQCKQEAMMRNPPVAHSHLLSPPCSGRHSLAGRAFRIPNAAAAVTTTIVIRQERTLTLPSSSSSPAEWSPCRHSIWQRPYFYAEVQLGKSRVESSRAAEETMMVMMRDASDFELKKGIKRAENMLPHPDGRSWA